MLSNNRRGGTVVSPRTWCRVALSVAFTLLLTLSTAHDVRAQQPPDQSPAPSATQSPTAQSITCVSKPGERNSCPADTSAGVVLLRSTGEGPCLLGKTWGYDQTSIWVSDGCSGEFAKPRRFDACPEIARGSGIWEEAQLTHAHLNRTTGRGGGKRTL